MLRIGKIVNFPVQRGDGTSFDKLAAEFNVDGLDVQYFISNPTTLVRSQGEYKVFSYVPDGQFCRYVPVENLREIER